MAGARTPRVVAVEGAAAHLQGELVVDELGVAQFKRAAEPALGLHSVALLVRQQARGEEHRCPVPVPRQVLVPAEQRA